MCEYCGKEFHSDSCEIKRGRGKFCSRKCKGQWMSQNLKRENSLNWRGGEITRYCIICGKKIELPKCWVKRGRGFFCSQKCLAQWRSENKSGENSWAWRGGKSFEPYGVEFSSKLREQIRKRDHYTCQQCGYIEGQFSQKLDTHHINYNKLDNEPANLISLCKSCHSKTNYKREDWIQYFQEKII